MKAKKITFISLSLVLILAFLLSGCGAPTATPISAPTEAPTKEAAAPTEQPTVAQPGLNRIAGSRINPMLAFSMSILSTPIPVGQSAIMEWF